MPEFFEMDPVTGIRTDTSYDESDGNMNLTVHRSADVEPLLDYTKAMSNAGDISKRGIQESWWLYAKLPPIVILQLRAKGIDVFNKNDEKRMFEEINTEFPHLKCTTGQHGGKVKVHG
ncbi:MAG: hypothetical protein ACREQ5_09640 [Candidatus Dormibacteria bacterium]